MDDKEIQGMIYKWVADNFGESEANDPSWNIEALAKHLAQGFKEDTHTLFKHTTGGGAVYLVDNHRIADAKIVIRLDGGAELVGCKVEL